MIWKDLKDFSPKATVKKNLTLLFYVHETPRFFAPTAKKQRIFCSI